MKVHILDDWFHTLEGLSSFAKIEGHDVTVWSDHVEDVDLLAERLSEAEAVVLFRERTPVTAALLARLPRLRLISQRGPYPHVDVAACTAQGVLLASNMSAGMPSYAAAELTWGMILSAMRQIPQQMASLRAGDWQMGVGRTLRGRPIGLYGYGRISGVVAGYAAAFGMQVSIWGSEDARQRAKFDGLHVPETREAFFAGCDVISLHVKLTPQTRGIITAADLGVMRTGSVLVNTSRSGLIEQGALLAGLNAGRPGMAALDVFDTEPLTDTTDPLMAHPHVICTPHIGYVTEDELDMQFGDIYDQINAYAKGAPIHLVNPEAQPAS
ncbi:D-2-hydroxyacid dehydrogenase family protein [Seohaeicola saemankumensis]|uniref:D-2-hydroxyacid dehydrogenase family protein n=1 Tax=Seohaeicola saemankumensis TaxID=481181 RepID=UPI001E4B4181|nr:D-2-hydroxyacid dehydrogenase family protein [Seohaeicola saemankumensis]MCD1625286.1 D-2-hydroxyacid dehydrogenase family protein [Seohaeicola saemankumensis]